MSTIAKEVELAGIGIHSGREISLRLKPSRSGGILFRRTDLSGLEFSLTSASVRAGNRTCLIKGEHRIQTVEHLAAALFALEISHLVIELDGEEIPILDGSALPFTEAINSAGYVPADEPNPRLRLIESFSVRSGAASLSVEPAAGFLISYVIGFDHPAIGTQSMEIEITPQSFSREIAPARTFGFLKDVPDLWGRDLARGGSLENALILDETGIMNGPLRFPDEFVRHKILDLIGDLALLGHRPSARFTVERGGHALHQKAVVFLRSHPDHWALSDPR